MNEAGLAIGMAAVPAGQGDPDPNKETIGSLGVIRQMLDRAGNVAEAVEILSSYNVDMGGGPPLHYLMADADGGSALVEFYQGELVIIPRESSWHQATNFLRASAGEEVEGQCWRYDTIDDRLQEKGGRLSAQGAMDLLAEVAQPNTQWSIVYGLSGGQIDVALERDYETVHTFRFDEFSP
jgi:hypothetical protein